MRIISKRFARKGEQMKVIPYKATIAASPVKDDDDDKDVPSLDASDESLIVQKAKSGALEDGEKDIDAMYAELDHDVFPELKNDEPGDKVVAVLVGEVEKVTATEDGDYCLVCFHHASIIHGKKPPLGSGQRFKTLEKSLSKKGSSNPGALAAYIGRKKYGAKKMGQLSAHGRK